MRTGTYKYFVLEKAGLFEAGFFVGLRYLGRRLGWRTSEGRIQRAFCSREGMIQDRSELSDRVCT